MSSESEMKSSQNMSSDSNLELEYSGGLGSAMNILGWIHSLDSYKTWQVIKYDYLTPIICFFPEELRNKAITAFIRYSYYPDTDKPRLLNGINYASRALDLINREKLLSKGSQPKTVDKKKKKKDKLLQLSYSPKSNEG
ncbi:MAG: hypothetical protein F6K40_00625 [Okeania sp. SIO3I5]|nr:hypothetical protein [Okeania sp. SIO3I5]NEQ34892.1 hypothetical protein [Okeania sp. SIO3I5]